MKERLGVRKKKTAINCLDVASIHFRLETSPASQVVPRFNQKHNGRKDSKKLRNPLCNGEHFIQLRSIGALASLGTCPCFQQLFCWGKSHDEWKSRFRNTGVSAVSIIQSSAINESPIATKDQPSYIECTKILNAVTPMINLLHPPQDTSGYQTSPLKLLWTFATMWKNCRKVILIKIRFFVHHILFPFSKSVGKLAMSLFGASLLTVASTA